MVVGAIQVCAARRSFRLPLRITLCQLRSVDRREGWIMGTGIATGFQASFDGSVKSPISALRVIPRHCKVPISTPHSSGFASLDLGAFYETICFSTFYGSINFGAFGSPWD